MNREEYRTGLWKKQSQKGLTYCAGKLKIGDREYKVTLFKNDKKGNDKAPDFNLIVRLEEQKQESPKEEDKPKLTYTTDDMAYIEFGNATEVTDDDLPF